MNSLVTGYAFALLVALCGAYVAWTHEGDPDLAEATVILQLDREDLEAVEFESPELRVRLDLREDALGEYVWVSTEPKPPDAPQPPVAPGEEAPKAGKEAREPQAFKAGASGDVIARGMAPFVAKRVLEGIEDAKLEELGFGDEQGVLTLHRRGRDPVRYTVGAKPPGTSSTYRYVREPSTGTIYIVASNLLDTLETAERSLPDRTLVGFEASDVETVAVRGGEASVTFRQHNPDDRDARYWAVEGSDESNAAAAGWMDKALRLRVSTYLPEGEPEPAGLEEVFSFAAVAGRKTVDVTVYRASGENLEENWYARSAHNRSLVQLHRASAAEAYADLPAVLDASP